MTFFFGRVENSVKKGENASEQHFLIFPQCLQIGIYSMVETDALSSKGIAYH